MNNIISELTKNCLSEDCQITGGLGISTLLAWSAVYDKHGNPINKNPNTITTSYRCEICRKHWQIHEKSGERIITEMKL